MSEKLSVRELRAVLLLVPFLILMGLVVYYASLPDKSERSAEPVAERADSSIVQLQSFDPNTVTYEQLRDMGVPSSAAVSLIKYRKRGKQFEIAEDVALCYGIDDSLYAVLKPYIKIDAQYALKPRRTSGDAKPHAELFEFAVDTAGVATFCRLGFSPRQSEVIVRYRESVGGFASAEDFERCYVVSPEQAERLRPYIIYPQTVATVTSPEFPVEINSADSATLVAVRGIGAKSAAAIIRYRKRLGGFCRVEQLAEVAEVTERNYEMILQQICVDSCVIQKIRINFAPRDELSNHPYINNKLVRNILSVRLLKGGWYSKEDFLNNNILTAVDKQKLLPYLDFEANTTNNFN